MHKVSFEPVNEEGHDTVNWWMFWTLVSDEVYLYSQHIKVTKNTIAELLSRYFHILYQSLTNIFNSILPPHKASSFHIKPPPINIISCIFSLSSSSTQTEESPKPLQPSSLENRTDGINSSHTQASRKITVRNPTRIKDHPVVVICGISVKKPI